MKPSHGNRISMPAEFDTTTFHPNLPQARDQLKVAVSLAKQEWERRLSVPKQISLLSAGKIFFRLSLSLLEYVDNSGTDVQLTPSLFWNRRLPCAQITCLTLESTLSWRSNHLPYSGIDVSPTPHLPDTKTITHRHLN